MVKLLIVFFSCVLLARAAEKRASFHPCGEKQPWNAYVVAIILIFSLLAGLRTGYNDTAAYRTNFRNSESFEAFIADPENLDPMHNPLFYGITCLMKSMGIGIQMYFMLFAILDTALFIRFIQRYSPEQYFSFGIFLFFTVGTAVFSLAAMKQVTAMAIMTLALPLLLDRRWLAYYLIVFIAGLIHTYAFFCALLPFFAGKPWGLRTVILVGATLLIMATFEETLLRFLEFADSYGKHLAQEEVLDPYTMNIFRVAVYGVVPMLSLVYRHRIWPQMHREQMLMINMSILSFMFMLVATIGGANMFGRMANYFELGTICALPWLVDQIWDSRKQRLFKQIACICYFAFFLYDSQTFSSWYTMIQIF